MKCARFRFYGELCDFLRLEQRDQEIELCFRGRQSIKHLIESLHVPHTEIGLIYVNGEGVELSYLMEHGDRAEIYPAEMRWLKNGKPRFLLDNHLGKLATYLRILGFDARYRNDFQDDELAQVAVDEERILLTRDRGLLMRRSIQYGYYVRAEDPFKQTAEILERFSLYKAIEPFQRCLRCNSPLQPVSKETVLHRLQPLTRKYYNEFHLCPECNQVYWKGSHYERMLAFLRKLTDYKF